MNFCDILMDKMIVKIVQELEPLNMWADKLYENEKTKRQSF